MAAIELYVSAPWGMSGIDEKVQAVIDAAAATGTTLLVSEDHKWWKTGGAAGIDAATGKPAIVSKSEDLTPAQKQDKLGADAAKIVKYLKKRATAKSKAAPHAMLVLADGTLKSTHFLQGVAVGAGKHVVVLSPNYKGWIEGAEGAAQPSWIGQLAMTPTAATFVATPEEAAAALIQLATPKPPKVKAPAAAVAEDPQDVEEDDEEEAPAPAATKPKVVAKTKKAAAAATTKKGPKAASKEDAAAAAKAAKKAAKRAAKAEAKAEAKRKASAAAEEDGDDEEEEDNE
jgi:hypothetical protein